MGEAMRLGLGGVAGQLCRFSLRVTVRDYRTLGVGLWQEAVIAPKPPSDYDIAFTRSWATSSWT